MSVTVCKFLAESSRLTGSISGVHTKTKQEQGTRISQHEYSNVRIDVRGSVADPKSDSLIYGFRRNKFRLLTPMKLSLYTDAPRDRC